MPYSLWFIW